MIRSPTARIFASLLIDCDFAVFGKHKTPFKKVFDATQDQLRNKFGMQLVELPAKEKSTLRDRRGINPSSCLLSRELSKLTAINHSRCGPEIASLLPR